MANSVDPDQTAPIGAICSGSTLFASILNSSVMLGNYLQQTTSADDIFSCIFFLTLWVNACQIYRGFKTDKLKKTTETSYKTFGQRSGLKIIDKQTGV